MAKGEKSNPEASLSEVVERLAKLEAQVARLTGALEPLAGSTLSPPMDPAEEAAPTDQTDTRSLPVDEDVGHLLQGMFGGALLPDDEEAYLALEALTHSRELAAPRAADHLRAFAWKKLRRGAERYLTTDAADSFRVDRTEKSEASDGTVQVKVFLATNEGNPAPVTLLRDEAAGGQWRIVQLSL